MKRSDAMAKLRVHAAAVRAMGAASMYLYGSTARDEAGLGSDVDVFLDYDPKARFNAFDLVGIKQFLEAQLNASINVTTRDGLHPRLRERIEDDALRIF